MKGSRAKKILARCVALSLASILFMTDASAAAKHIYVWGVRSINDRGSSDVKISMDDMEKDYSGYLQSDGLVEYFHKDRGEIPKANMTEALAWLIENQIISRDSVITVSNVSAIPVTRITKEDISAKMYRDVTRSDALMYIYKCTFGPLTGRVIGVETQNIRTDNGVEKTLHQMFLDHDYYETISEPIAGIIQQGNTGGDFSVQQSCVTTPDGHYDHQTTSGVGGSAGHQELGVIHYNNENKWRYTSQGDKVVTVFGDTNIFVSDIDISQQANTGSGQMGSIVGSSHDGESVGSVDQDDHSRDSVTGEWSSQTGNHNNQNTGFGGTGGINAGINIDMDYKEIYYTPASDVLFYHTTDVVEMYLQSLQSKGIIEFEKSLRTEQYDQMFTPLTEDGAPMASWSGDADPYIVNLRTGKHRRAENVSYAPTSKVLGKLYSIDYNTQSFTIRRTPLFESETGYFTTEQVNRMDVYRYIYNMVSANEKKLTALESEIVNYKYGLQYGDGLPEGDLEVIKFLVAKGILNYDGSDELSGLYAPMTWSQLIPILYRVANKNARLDFSQIQLTDSEQAWKAQGFLPSSLSVKSSGSMSQLEFRYTDEYLASMVPDIDPNGADQGIGGGVQQMSMRSTTVTAPKHKTWLDCLSEFFFGAPEPETVLPVQLLEAGAPNLDVDNLNRQYQARAVQVQNNPFVLYVDAVDDKVADIVYTTNSGSLCLNHRLYFDFMGAVHVNNDDSLDEFKTLLTQMDTERRFVYDYIGDTYNANNPKHRLLVEYLQNFHFIAAMRGNADIANEYKAIVNEWADNPSDTIKNATGLDESKGWTVSWQDRRKDFQKYVNGELDNMVAGKNMPSNVQYHHVTPGAPGAAAVSDLYSHHCTDVLLALEGSSNENDVFKITFDYTTSTGDVEQLELHFKKPPASSEVVTEDDKAAAILNACTVEYQTAVSAQALASSQDSALMAKAGSQLEVMNRHLGINFAQVGDNGNDIDYYDYFSDATLSLYADPTSLDQGYVKWSDISAASSGDIIRQSELILYNTKTNTTAYFSYDADPSKTRAIVGAIVINGDSKYGVVKKVSENGVDEIYYHLNAVRQLMSLSDEKECIGGRSCIAKADEVVAKNTESYPVTNSLGTQSSSVQAVKAVVHADASAGDAIHSTNPYYKEGVTLGQYHYCDFISLAQTNRVANIIYRKFTYTPEPTAGTSVMQSGRGVAYGVVIFRPADMDEVGSPAVSSSTSLQDLLDAPGQAPAGDQTAWNRNKQLCNDYANWIYGTSGISYVNTGYLVPEVYLFLIGDAATKRPPNAIYGTLTEAERKAISMGEMGIVTMGRTAPRRAKGNADTKVYEPSDSRACNYYMDTNYRAMLSGDRLFLNEAMFDNIQFKYVSGKYTYVLTNSTQVMSPFSVGNVFTFFNTADGREYGNPTARVTAVSSNGEVTCQVGPFYGIPVRYNGKSTVARSNLYNASMTLAEGNWTGKGKGTSTKEKGVDLWQQFYSDATSAGLTKDWIDGAKGNVITPALFGSKDSGYTTRVVFDGSNVKVYEDDKTVNITKAVSVSTGTQKFNDVYKALKKQFEDDQKITDASSILNRLYKSEAYYEIKFSAWHYTIKNGVLNYNVNTGMGAFLNPMLFTSINDVLIDGMIDESSGAIPVNEIPAGSLLKIGDYYYQAVGTSTDQKVFVGYAPLYEYVDKPAVVHAAKAFTTQMVYAGNQYVNVSHWMDPVTMLQNGKQSVALSDVAKKTLVGDARQKFSVDFNGDIKTIETGVEVTGDSSAMFSPIEIRFIDGLLAYKSTTVEQTQASASDEQDEQEKETQEGGTDTYLLCNHTQNAMSGALDDIPFLTDDVLSVSLYSVTTDIVSAGFKMNENAPGLRGILQLEFQKIFAGDLITLARMLVFLVLIWLCVASWMCYFMWLGNLLPILEAIRYPSGDRGKKGVDLMKLVSLGTISLDTDFKLGRFLQYNGILAILLCIVMLTGG